MSIESLLKNCYLCRDLDPDELAALNAIASFRRVKKGEMIFFEGDQAAGFFVLLEGRVRIYKASPDGKEYTLHIINPGQMFAEAVIFEGETFPANGAALQDSSVAFFPRDKFIALITGSPQISLKMLSALSEFVRQFNRQVEELSLKEVSARLASYFIKKTAGTGNNVFLLDISKAELARSLGTVSETLSRNLRKMKELGVVRVDGQTITVLDPDRLRKIADGDKN
ncbi:MAG: Crp/Fnr family transcriptional regulator [candidate division Zixibacteria bacterium]|nr:Crp/Fnr family transcriptional regulator [candidate division Zixibacteria bacterium]